MSLVISRGYNGVSDPDAARYISAVETQDGQALEFATSKAINNFIVGCKIDGIWDSIKICCILAGARKMEGAFLDIKTGTKLLANNGPFVESTDYNRKTGLKGNGTSKWLDTNRACSSEDLDNIHLSVYVKERSTLTSSRYIAGTGNPLGIYEPTTGGIGYRINSSGANVLSTGTSNDVFIGGSRATASAFTWRVGTESGSQGTASTAKSTGNYAVFAANSNSVWSDSRMSFFSIGSSLDLTLLYNRVATLVTAMGAIP